MKMNLKFFSYLFLAGLTIVVLSSASWAGTKTWDFAADDGGLKASHGKWAVKGGIFQVEGTANAMHANYVEDETKTWENYTVEARVRPAKTGNTRWAGIVFRAQPDLHEYYVYYMNTPNNTTEFWMHKKGAWDSRQAFVGKGNKDSNNPAKGGIKIAQDKWHDMKVVCSGSKFSFYFDGKLQCEYEDKTYKTGGVGVWSWAGPSSFDNLKVTGEVIAAVDPQEKLTATWGSLKTTR